jgi:hypothetical protein
MQAADSARRRASPAIGEDRDSAAPSAARGGAIVAASADECFPARLSGGTPADPALAFERKDAPGPPTSDFSLRPAAVVRPDAAGRLLSHGGERAFPRKRVRARVMKRMESTRGIPYGPIGGSDT